jgi:hypothetical protein
MRPWDTWRNDGEHCRLVDKAIDPAGLSEGGGTGMADTIAVVVPPETFPGQRVIGRPLPGAVSPARRDRRASLGFLLT